MPTRKSQYLDWQLVKIISKEYFPFSTVEDPEFKEMLKCSIDI